MLIREIIEGAYEYNKTHEVYWRDLSPEQQEQWRRRRGPLEQRARRVYSRLVQLMPPEEARAVRGVPVTVPIHGEMSWAAADYEKRIITVDLGCFWDLPDDCLAYTLGHEIGHFVYESKNPGYWRKRISAARRRQEEIDADIYGALLAYRLGYNPKLAFAHFTRQEQAAPFDPKYPNYPSVSQRRAAKDAAIKKDRDSRAQPPVPEPTVPPTTGPETLPEPPLSPAAKDDIDHAQHGIEGLLALLGKDPQVAVAMFPDPGMSTTALA